MEITPPSSSCVPGHGGVHLRAEIAAPPRALLLPRGQHGQRPPALTDPTPPGKAVTEMMLPNFIAKDNAQKMQSLRGSGWT